MKKENEFHGNYLQGKRHSKYEKAIKTFFYVLIIAWVGILVFTITKIIINL